MFENDSETGLDLDDEFLNVDFQSEGDNNTPIRNATSTNGSVELNRLAPLRLQDFMKNDLPEAHESFCTRNDFSSSTADDCFPQLNHVNKTHQIGNGNVGDQENKRKVPPPPSRSKRERKFPGPAGLLPERKSSRGTPLKLDSLLEVASPSASTPDELCSQGRLSGSVLEDGPWQSLMLDLGSHTDLLNVVNVASVKRKAAARCFVGRKVPFLAAMLHYLDVSSADPCIILRDSTGEIHGTLHRDVWQQFATELVVGSVLVIRNVGLLSTGISSRRHYLNITANNLATIYSASPEREQKRVLHALTSQDYLKTIDQWQSLVAPLLPKGSPSSSLFGNTSLPSSACSSPAQRLQMNGVQPHIDDSRQPRTPHVSNVKQTSQNMQDCANLYLGPQFPRTVPPSRQMRKILFPSGNSVCAKSSNTNLNLLNNSRPPTRVSNQSNIVIGRDKPNSVQTSTTSNVQDIQFTRPPTFNFEMLKTKPTNCGGSSPNNNGKLSTCEGKFRKDYESSAISSNPRVILSQTSQLTVEEQSVVDSVFDGIDADSLFEDDF